MARPVDQGKKLVEDFNKSVDKHVKTVGRHVTGHMRRARRQLREVHPNPENLSFRDYLRKVWWILRQDKSPHSLALGFGLGVAFGVLPIPIFDTLVGLFLAFWLRANKLMYLFGLAALNPLLLPLNWTTSLSIGTHFFGKQGAVMWSQPETLLHLWKPFLFGNLLLALTVGVVGYAVVFALSWLIQRPFMRRDARKRGVDKAL